MTTILLYVCIAQVLAPAMTTMLLFACFALILAPSLAVPTGTMMTKPPMTTMMPSSPPTMCCPPKRWSAMMYDLKSPTALEYVTEFAQDAEKRLEGSVTVRVSDGMVVSQSFTDYNSMKMYTVNYYGDKACMVKTADHDFYADCHTNMTNMMATLKPKFMGNAVLGGDALKYDVWAITLWADVQATIALSTDKCIPILESVKSDTLKIDSLLLFNDVTTNVDDKLLNMPAPCIGSSPNGVVG